MPSVRPPIQHWRTVKMGAVAIFDRKPSMPGRLTQTAPLEPKSHAFGEMRRQFTLEEAADFLRMIARAEVGENNQLVAETFRSLHDVVQVHVAELVDLLAAVIGPNEADLGDQDLRLVHRRVI